MCSQSNPVSAVEQWLGRNQSSVPAPLVKDLLAEVMRVQAILDEQAYCPTCGFCGIAGCCTPGKCVRVKCVHGEDAVAQWRSMEEDAEAMFTTTQRLRSALSRALSMPSRPRPVVWVPYLLDSSFTEKSDGVLIGPRGLVEAYHTREAALEAAEQHGYPGSVLALSPAPVDTSHDTLLNAAYGYLQHDLTCTTCDSDSCTCGLDSLRDAIRSALPLDEDPPAAANTRTGRVACPKCHGRGSWPRFTRQICPDCKGVGFSRDGEGPAETVLP